MGWLQNIGNTVKRGVVGAGHAVGSVASNPWVQGAVAGGLALTGVGAPAAAGIMAATRGGGKLLAPGGNIGGAVRGAAEGAAMGAGASKLGAVARGGGSLLQKASGLYGAANGVAGSIPGAGAAGGFLRDAAGAVTGGGGGANLAALGLAGANVVNAGLLGAKSDALADQGLKYATDSYGERAPLRAKGIEGLMSYRQPGTSSDSVMQLAGLRAQNPTAARVMSYPSPPRPENLPSTAPIGTQSGGMLRQALRPRVV